MSWLLAQTTLDTRLKALPSLGSAAIQWGNVGLTSQTAMYYAAHFMPSSVKPELHGSDHEMGIYQVSVFCPINAGTGAALVAAQAVIDWFKRQVINGVSCGVPTLTRPIQDAAWWHVPVSIPFIVL